MLKTIMLGLSVAAIATSAAFAQGGIKRTPLQRIEYPDGYVTVTGLVEIAPGGASGRHSHPGIETGYVLEGELELVVDGQPVQHVMPGQSYQIPAGAVHDARAEGDKSMKVLGIFVVDKSKPFASPAP